MENKEKKEKEKEEKELKEKEEKEKLMNIESQILKSPEAQPIPKEAPQESQKQAT